jgi:hypothetical protein
VGVELLELSFLHTFRVLFFRVNKLDVVTVLLS